MLKEVLVSSLPRFNLPRERVEFSEVPNLQIIGSENVRIDSIGNVVKAVVTIGNLMQCPVIFTLEQDLSLETSGIEKSLSIMSSFFERVLLLKEGNLYKVQMERVKESKQVESEKFLNPYIKNFFSQYNAVLEPTGVKAYKVEREKGTSSSEKTENQSMFFLTEYFLREARMNKGLFCTPIGNLSKEEIELTPYIDFLANQFKEVYVVGAGAGTEWFSTHIILVDPFEDTE